MEESIFFFFHFSFWQGKEHLTFSLLSPGRCSNSDPQNFFRLLKFKTIELRLLADSWRKTHRWIDKWNADSIKMKKSPLREMCCALAIFQLIMLVSKARNYFFSFSLRTALFFYYFFFPPSWDKISKSVVGSAPVLERYSKFLAKRLDRLEEERPFDEHTHTRIHASLLYRNGGFRVL
jgi:hypothetical protein